MNSKHRSFDTSDGKMTSRKFLLTLLSLALITIVTMLTALYPPLAAVMPTFVAGIMGTLSVYFTGNVVAKHITGNNIAKLTDPGEDR